MKNLFKDHGVIREIFTYSMSGIIVVSFFLIIYNFPVVKSIIDSIMGIMMPFIWGVLFYLLLGRPCIIIEEHLPKTWKKSLRRNIATLSCVLLLFLIIFAFLAILAPQLLESCTRLGSNLSRYLNQFVTWYQNLDIKEFIDASLITQASSYIEGLLDNMIDIVESGIPTVINTTFSTISNVASFIIGIIICIYILLERDDLHRQFTKLGNAFLNDDYMRNVTRLLSQAVIKFNSFIRGKIIDSVIVGVICFITMSILGLDYVILISFIVACTNIIPVFGPFIGAIPSAFLLLVVDPMQCLVFIILIFIIQQIDGNIIGPAVLGDSIGLSKFWIMFAIIVGGGMFGIVGMFFGVPLFALIHFFLSEYVNLRIAQKEEKPDSLAHK